MVIYKNHYKTVKSVILNLENTFVLDVTLLIWIYLKSYSIVKNVIYVFKVGGKITFTVKSVIHVEMTKTIFVTQKYNKEETAQYVCKRHNL